jgi:hypothetical protein
LYCPDAFVARDAMAAFMNRLGRTLTPAFVRTRDDQLGAQDITQQKNFCPTSSIAAATYPRSAIVRGVLNLYTPSGGADGLDAKTWIVYSTDGGTTWLNPSTLDGYAYGSIYVGRVPPADITLYPSNVIDVNPGVAYRFAVATQRTAGTATLANVYCENLVQIVNRNGTSSPFDEIALPGSGGRGD